MTVTVRSRADRVVAQPPTLETALAPVSPKRCGLQAKQGFDDEPRALLHGQPRGVQDQVIEQKIGEIIAEMLLDEATPLTVRGLHVAGRLGGIEAALPADQRDPILA